MKSNEKELTFIQLIMIIFQTFCRHRAVKISLYAKAKKASKRAKENEKKKCDRFFRSRSDYFLLSI